ncbi:hypothetical protein Tco_1490671 [Tanacetum coccineum]
MLRYRGKWKDGRERESLASATSKGIPRVRIQLLTTVLDKKENKLKVKEAIRVTPAANFSQHLSLGSVEPPGGVEAHYRAFSDRCAGSSNHGRDIDKTIDDPTQGASDVLKILARASGETHFQRFLGEGATVVDCASRELWIYWRVTICLVGRTKNICEAQTSEDD